MASSSNEPLSKTGDLELDTADPAVSSGETLHDDPITGEPGAHPAAVGVGALGAGAAGAAIGMLVGPIGAIIGAAVGAVAGGLAGHEVAVSNEEAAAAETKTDLDAEAAGATTQASGRPSSVAASAPEDTLTVFPGSSDFGSPAVTTESEDAGAVSEGAPAVEPSSGTKAGAVPVPVPRHDAFAADDEDAAGSGIAGASSGSGFVSGAASGSGVPAVSASAPADERADFAAEDKPADAGFSIGPDVVETVRTAAYYRYLGRQDTGRPGDELSDWCEAEQEVTRF